jgi:hypothetical protein
MATYTYRGKSAYIDDRLAFELENNVIPDLQKDDTDFVFCIDGKERSGKSKFADNIAGFVASKLDIDYSEDNFYLSPTQFRDGILKSKKRQIAIYDEAHKGMGSRRSLSEINNILVDLMMEMGQKNLFVILVLPTFFMLDKYAAIHRTHGLFHVYKSKDRNEKTRKRRRYWVFFNEKNKIELYIKGRQYLNYNVVKFPPFRGTFYDQWIIDKVKYMEKKKNSFKEHGKKETKAEIYINQRNKVIYALSRELDIGYMLLMKKLRKYNVKFSKTAVQDILNEMNDVFNDKTSEKTEELIDDEANIDKEVNLDD